MSQENQADACMRQAEYWYGSYNGRRDFEWKITLGLWGGILAAVNVLIGNKGLQKLEWWFWIIPFVLHIFWLRGVWVANENDKRCMQHFQTEAENTVINKLHQVKIKPKKISRKEWKFWLGFILDWSTQFQLLITIALVFLAIRMCG